MTEKEAMEQREVEAPPIAVDLEPVDASVIAVQERAMLDVRISTAKKYPRDIARVRKDILSWATVDQFVAASCFYALPFKDKGQTKYAEGPSVRLAEIVYNAWTNIHVGARLVEHSKSKVVAQCIALDTERNVSANIEVHRSILNSKGEQYSERLQLMTINAAASIAFRNGIFRIVPRAFINAIEPDIRRVALGESKTLVARREDMLSKFAEYKVTKEMICKLMNRSDIEAINLEDMARLTAIYTAIRTGEGVVEEIFEMDTAQKEKPKASILKRDATKQPEASATPAENATTETKNATNPPLTA